MKEEGLLPRRRRMIEAERKEMQIVGWGNKVAEWQKIKLMMDGIAMIDQTEKYERDLQTNIIRKRETKEECSKRMIWLTHSLKMLTLSSLCVKIM